MTIAFGIRSVMFTFLHVCILFLVHSCYYWTLRIKGYLVFRIMYCLS